MPKLRLVLTIIGWLLAMAIAVTASSTSVIYAYRYGLILAGSEPQPWLTGAALAIADVVKIGLPAIIVALWARSHSATARTLSVVFAMLLGLSLWSLTSITAIERAANDAKATNASRIEADLRNELAAAENRIVELGSPPPVAAVEAEIDSVKADARWRTTAACNPVHIFPSTQRFCEKAALKQAALANASEAGGLRVRIDEIRRKLTTPPPDVAKIASPELTTISDVFGWRTESVGFARAVFFAISLELLGAFVPSAVWYLRPTVGASSPAPTGVPQPAKVADTSIKPKSPAPPAPSRQTARTPSTGKRGRRRDPNVLDFVRKFRERHGRSPNIPEMRAQFPDLHKSTLWRATQAASEEDGRRQLLSA
ncbi:hypothetical protein [Hyphomicrobium sp.]|uniref:hypothetical protein n=1 Tax=Hyphomicrobium sp. TaxID=82 RepID=UPI001DE09183|nr:hypothetical protein [Hyphomicrobium sp.]MBY0559314.1 hypothetical protein [Hyphomicrobium sp.]